MSEIWRDIPGYEGSYQVSDLGRVRSLDRVVKGPRGPKRLKGKVLKLTPNPRDRYLQIILYQTGKGTLYKAHRLVLEAFVGPCPEGHETGHRDGSRANNCLQNLRYITKSKNNHEITKHGRRKLTSDQVRAIRERVAAGETLVTLAPEFDVAFSTIGRVANREYYASVPDHA